MSAASKLPLHEDQTICAQLLDTIAAACPLQILPSKIPDAGSGLFTTKDIEEGEEIFRSEPLVSCVDRSFQSFVCDYCYKNHNSPIGPNGRFLPLKDDNLRMKACSGCGVCYYCSRTCQKAAWRSYHKHECTIFSEEPDLYPRTRALFRLLSMNKLELLTGQRLEAFFRLQSHQDELLSTGRAQNIIPASEFATSRTKTLISSSKVRTLYCILLSNCISVYPAEGKSLGTSLDVVTSLMNHSCDPNAFVFFEGRSLRVRSTRKLFAGDEVTQCYTDVGMDVLFRRPMLSDEYFFDCHCSRCEKEMQEHEKRSLNSPGWISEFEQSQHKLIELMNAAVEVCNSSKDPVDVDKLGADLQSLAKEAFPDGIWPEDLAPMPGLNMQLARMLKDQNRLIEALRYGIKGCISLERRRGRQWNGELFDLLQIFARVIKLPKQAMENATLQGQNFPSETQLWIIFHGYQHELVSSATRTFGRDTTYAEAIQNWYMDCLGADTALAPETRAFAKGFKIAQSKLLLWAGVDKSKSITLT